MADTRVIQAGCGHELKDELMAHAAYLARMGRFGVAEKALSPLSLCPDQDPRAIALLAKIYAQQGRIRDARRLFERASKLAPHNAEYKRAVLQCDRARNIRERIDCSRVLYPVFYAYYRLAVSLLIRPGREGAEAASLKYLADLSRACRRYMQHDDYPYLYTAAEKAFSDAWRIYGDQALSNGGIGESWSSYELAIRILPDNSEAWNSKGDHCMTMGHTEDAIKYYSRAIEMNETNEMALCSLGRCFLMTGRPEDAAMYYGLALKADPDNALLWLARGNIFAGSGQTAEAIECYDRAARIRPGCAMAWYHKALAESRLGMKEKAAESYKRFVLLSPA